MDGRGRAFDNIFIKKLWRSIKYKEVYLNDYSDITQAKKAISKYFEYYNYKRYHQGLNNYKPAEIYFNINYKNYEVENVKKKLFKKNLYCLKGKSINDISN